MKVIMEPINILRIKIMNIVTVIAHLWEKIGEAIQYPLAWIAGLGLFVADAVAGGRLICYIVILASVIDLVCGVAVSLKRKRFTLSELLRQTVEKLVVYGAALIVFLCLDRLIQQEINLTIDISAGLVGVVITMTETWSFLASLLILFPNNAFLKFLQKALTGELARKLGCDEKDVKAVLNASRKKKAIKRDTKGRFIQKKK